MGGLQTKLAASSTVIIPPASEESEEEEEDSQRSTPLPGPSSKTENAHPSQSTGKSKSAKSRSDMVTLMSLQKRVHESKKLTEKIEMMMEEVEDSRSAKSQYGV